MVEGGDAWLGGHALQGGHAGRGVFVAGERACRRDGILLECIVVFTVFRSH